MYFHKSWPLSFELQTNPAHFWVAAAPAVPKPGARSWVWSEGSALLKGPPLATPVCFGGFPLLKLCSLDSSKFSNFIIFFLNKNVGYQEIGGFPLNVLSRFFFCELLQSFLQFTQAFSHTHSTQQEVPKFNPSSSQGSIALTMETPSLSYCQGICQFIDTPQSTTSPAAPAQKVAV